VSEPERKFAGLLARTATGLRESTLAESALTAFLLRTLGFVKVRPSQPNLGAQNDEPRVVAAHRLVERLHGRVCAEVYMPPRPAKDWNDVSVTRSADPPDAKRQGRVE
jgi:hypothetical protein